MPELRKVDLKPSENLFKFMNREDYIEELEDIYHNYASLSILEEESDPGAPNHLSTLRLIITAFKETKVLRS